MKRSLALAALLFGVFWALNLAWLRADRLVRDGDEEGHVGAAELFLDDLRNQRWAGAASRAFVEDMGDYPSLYPATVGAWWWALGGGQPGRPPVRAVNLGLLALAGLAVAGAARRLEVPAGAAALGGAAVLFLPLNAGLARHFMPEGALVTAVALTLWAAAAQRQRPDAPHALLLGLALGAGLLTKQTFPLYVAAPLLLLVRWTPSLALVPLGAAVALPWLLVNHAEQLAYLGGSAGYAAQATALDHALYYPRSVASLDWGPLWTGLALVALVVAARGQHRRAAAVAAAWLVGGLLVLSLIPKKYDRLAAPLLPAAGLALAAALPTRPRLGLLVVPGVAWTTWVSFQETRWNQPTDPIADFHPGCVQRWLRAPVAEDMGYDAVVEAARVAPPGPVLVLGAPEVPCAVQTTFGWTYHLGPWLRRAGADREVVEEGQGALTVDFRHPERPGPAVEVPLLNTRFHLSR